MPEPATEPDDQEEAHELDLSTCEVYESDTRIEGDKRTALPAGIWWYCPRCGHQNDYDFAEHYLSYPVWNNPYTLYVSCRECARYDYYESYDITIIPRVAIEIVTSPVEE